MWIFPHWEQKTVHSVESLVELTTNFFSSLFFAIYLVWFISPFKRWLPITENPDTYSATGDVCYLHKSVLTIIYWGSQLFFFQVFPSWCFSKKIALIEDKDARQKSVRTWSTDCKDTDLGQQPVEKKLKSVHFYTFPFLFWDRQSSSPLLHFMFKGLATQTCINLVKLVQTFMDTYFGIRVALFSLN